MEFKNRANKKANKWINIEMNRLILVMMLAGCSLLAKAQFTHGTTGLLEMPTADMQKDKTFMVGGGYLDNTVTPPNWTYNTWNYYLNITIFPWLEVAYACTIFNHWNKNIHIKNQDRNYSVRLRLWKEGWWKKWTPQIVIGSNDVGTSSGDNGGTSVGDSGNGYWNRYFLAATKHFTFQQFGELGLHASYLYNRRKDNPLNGSAFGVNFRFGLQGSGFWSKAVNGVNLMAEYDSKHVNIGGAYSVWKDRIHAYFELSQCKHPSAGLRLSVCLK